MAGREPGDLSLRIIVVDFSPFQGVFCGFPSVPSVLLAGFAFHSTFPASRAVLVCSITFRVPPYLDTHNNKQGHLSYVIGLRSLFPRFFSSTCSRIPLLHFGGVQLADCWGVRVVLSVFRSFLTPPPTTFLSGIFSPPLSLWLSRAVDVF